jgi:hypothetical protein
MLEIVWREWHVWYRCEQRVKIWNKYEANRRTKDFLFPNIRRRGMNNYPIVQLHGCRNAPSLGCSVVELLSYLVDSSENNLIPFGWQDGAQNHALQMGLSKAIACSETDRSHNIKKPLGLATFAPAPGLEIDRDIRWVLVLFLSSAWTNLAARVRRSPNKRTTDDQQSNNNAYRCVESAWIPRNQGSGQRMQMDEPSLYW